MFVTVTATETVTVTVTVAETVTCLHVNGSNISSHAA